jgi:acyl-CoA thioesterase-1
MMPIATYMLPLSRCAVPAIIASLTVCAITACGGGSGSAPVTVPAPVQAIPAVKLNAGTWVVIGSSTAEGAGAAPGKGWVALTQASYEDRGARIVNLAKGGTTTYQGRSTTAPTVAGRPAPDPERNIDKALSLKPAFFVVYYPTNDTALGYSIDETVNNLLTIRALALAANVPVIILSSQPRDLPAEKLAQLRVIDERLAAAVGACFVEAYQPLSGADGRLASTYDSSDGVHPNGAGHQLIANRVKTLIDSQKCVITFAP